jgi:predicted ester cyclase
MPLLAAFALLAAATPQAHAPVDDKAAYWMTRPREVVLASDIPVARLKAMMKPVNAFYAFWVNASPSLLKEAIGNDFVDHTLPAGRPQGPQGPARAAKAFLGAVPDLQVTVVQRLIVRDRVVSHLRFTGHFSGTFAGKHGDGRPVDFIATDILRVRDGRITDNWHLEDNLTFLQQIGVVAK